MLVSQAQYAQSRGFSKQYVSKLIKQKILTLHDRKIDEDEADKRLLSIRVSAKPSKMDDVATPQTKDLSEVLMKMRIRAEDQRVRMMELKNKRTEGSLVIADEVKIACFNQARMVRDAFLNLPSRVSSLLINQQDADVVHNILMKEVRQIVEELIDAKRDDNSQTRLE